MRGGAAPAGGPAGSAITAWRERPGSETRKVLPRPGSLRTAMSPPSAVTIPWTMERPSPVPTPTGLSVQNGSKIRSIFHCSMPAPVSSISINASPLLPVRVRTTIECFSGAPSGIACAALTNRFRKTWAA